MEKISPYYNEAVQQIKSAILESQLETARAANKQMLSLYYAIGKFVSENSRKGTWGTGAISTISAQLRRELPGLRGFSASNIKKMRIFFERWLPVLNRQPTADELENAEKIEKSAKIPIFALLNLNRPPLANELDFSEFLELSFTHHMEILLKRIRSSALFCVRVRIGLLSSICCRITTSLWGLLPIRSCRKN